MANYVQSDYEQLRQISQRFQTRAQSVLQITQRLSQHHQRLQQSWQGQGATAFTGEMNRVLFPALSRLHKALQSATRTTQQIAQTMQAAEQEAAALFRSEPAGAPQFGTSATGGAIGTSGGASSNGASGNTTTVAYKIGGRDDFNNGDGNGDPTPTPTPDPEATPEATAEPTEESAPEAPFQSGTSPIAADSIEWVGGFGANQYARNTYNAWSAAMQALNEEIALVENPTPEQTAAWDARRKEINDDYPYENTGGLHGGLDFGADAGTDVVAIADGEIVDMYSNDARPNVVVRYGEGDDAYYVIYGHVDLGDDFKVGDTIAAGDVVGTIDDQGSNSHLHLTVRQDNTVYNPIYFFNDDSGVADTFEDASYPEGESADAIYSFDYTGQANYWSDSDAEELGIEE